MKHCLLLFILLAATVITQAQETMPGYYITPQNDTVRVQIKVPKAKLFNVVAFAKFTNEVEIVDSLNRTYKLAPEDSKGFAFIYNGIRYTLMSKPIKNGNYKFLQPIVSGKKAGVYQYSATTGGGGGISNRMIYYTFENVKGEFVFLTNGATLNKFKEQLKKLYSDHAEVLPLIESKFQSRLNIENDFKEIVETVNKLLLSNLSSHAK